MRNSARVAQGICVPSGTSSTDAAPKVTRRSEHQIELTVSRASLIHPSFSYFERSGRRERKGNVIAHTVDDLENKTTERARIQNGTVLHRMTERRKKDPQFPLTCFSPRLILSRSLTEPRSVGKAKCINHFQKKLTLRLTGRPGSGGKNINFNDPSLRWRHPPRCEKGK